MNSLRLDFQIHDVSATPRNQTIAITRLVIAGWAGRDEASLRHHIEELAELGIAPPSKTPLFYAASARLLTQSSLIEVLGTESSGEAEPLLILNGSRMLIGLASDHTDRAAEAWSVTHSKQLCDKPIASDLWDFAEVAPHWDAIRLRASIPTADGGWQLYQDGTVAGLRRPDELAALAGDLGPGTAMLCGTMPAIGGIRPADRFRMELHDPILGRTITHEYGVTVLPIVS